MNRKIIIGALALAVLVGPSWASAETLALREIELRSKIETLLAEVTALQQRLDAAKAEEEKGRVAETFRLAGVLREGNRSDEVRTLQTLLAKDPQTYPEGYVTGYYGKLTARAVGRFKEKHGKPELTVESLAVPRIFDIAATTTNTTMTIAWKTNVPTSAKMWWGSPGPLDTERMTPVVASGLLSDHRAVFTGGIFASTAYAFIIAASDADGNTSTTTEQFYLTP